MDPELDRHIQNLAAALEYLRTLQNNPSTVRTTDSSLESLLNGVGWPVAVDLSEIIDVNSEAAKLERADEIIDIVLQQNLNSLPLQNTKVLDFGCGEGHVAKMLADRQTALSVGYDITEQSWSRFTPQANLHLTTSLDQVRQQGPYDFILAHDVLDHLVGMNMHDALAVLRALVRPDGWIVVRVHPWCSRHGSHLYQQINKAFVHLVFSDAELTAMGYKVDPNLAKVIHPIAVYREEIRLSGLQIVRDNTVHEYVEPFFTSGDIAVRIKANWASSFDPLLANGTNFPEFQMSQSFIDFILRA